ncbi:glycosyltransferase involved in cell wall biosynthesis [Rhodoferax ferrireducens]|uniref:Glycosyltransferase involved in cell wall biosynthesis n=2 Tax=Rhodoferax ferrireducens TaxID=192843 RepID=A0ABU2CC99_9BURK|nr:glycosyltransferase involved in cell wall biosynthesis [Rhodoferax ferrireducens]
MPSRMRILAFPYRGIAYNDGFYDALSAQGAEVISGEWAGKWLLQNLRKQDAVHIHWPSFLYASSGTSGAVLASFLRFVVLLAVMRMRTKKIYWTAHNLMPHDRCVLPWLDTLARHCMIAMVSKIFVHGASAQKVLVDRFPRAAPKCITIPHGNWIGHYPPEQTRETARAALGLPPDAFIYLFFGQCKPYKNLDGLMRIFLKQASRNDVLLVAGGFSDKQYLASIREIAGNDARIRLDARFIPNEEVSSYVMASDAMCVPYREILTSGTAMLALGFGKPVISINRGFLRDVIPSQAGILIEPDNAEQLAQALRTIQEKPWQSDAIIRHAKQFTYEDAAAIFLKEAAS